MAERRVGLWLIGALGGVGSTAALGLAALARGLAQPTGLVTALPPVNRLALDEPGSFVVGGHDIRTGTLDGGVRALARGSAVFDPAVIDACSDDLAAWSANVRPGTLLNGGDAIAALADRRDLPASESPRDAVARIAEDLSDFRSRQHLDQVVVVNVASTEPPFAAGPEHAAWDRLERRLDDSRAVPVSSLYALAAIESGCPYVNFTPSTGATLPALLELAESRRAILAGQDGKTGETLLKSVLAPMFARRNLRVLSWVGHNILGNRDGQILQHERNKTAKLHSKDRTVAELLGYEPQTHTSIEYIASLDDWKTAWDHVHFQGFLGVKMALQFTWQGCDSALAAPLVIDLARLALFAQRRGESGILSHLACFFKSPMGVREFDFARQVALLDDYARTRATQT